MNERTNALLKTFAPQLAIIAYTSGDDWHDAYLESHAIDAQGRILEGKPLKQETIEAMIDVFYNDRQQRAEISGIIPENLISLKHLPGGKMEMIWYNLPRKRHLYFSEQLHISSGEAWVPAIIYHTDGNGLDVYAWLSEGTSRPDEETQLFRAPFFNVNNSGDVCHGNAKIKRPQRTYQAHLQYWEDIFWLTEFTHINGDNPTKNNLALTWKNLIGTETRWDELDELLPSKRQLKGILP